MNLESDRENDSQAGTPSGSIVRRLQSLGASFAGTFASLLFLAPLAFIFDLAGYMPAYVRLFAIYLLLALPLIRYPRAAVLRGAGVLVAVMLVNAFAPLPQVAEIFLLTFAHLWIWSLSGQVSGRLAQGVVCYALLHVFLVASPIGYTLFEGMNRMVMGFGRWIAGGTLNTGYTYQNLGSLIFFLVLSIHAWDRSLISKARTAAFLVAVLLLNGLLSALLLFTVDLGPDLTWDLNFRELFSYAELASYSKRALLLVFPALIFLAHAVAYLVLHHEARPAPDTAEPEPAAPRKTGGRRTALAFTLVATLLLFLVAPPTTSRPSKTSKVVLLNRGVVSFSKPDYTRFSRAAGGMFGFFPDYAGLFGCSAEVVTNIPPLAPDHILVITNIDEPLTPEETERVWAFVHAGGGLWVLGDHTFIKNHEGVARNYVNDLLAPTNIRLNHDSAQFYPQGWFNAYRIRQGTPFASLEDPAENRLSILVGSSLKLKPPARPLIMGRFGYGDWGPEEDDEDRGYLGDFEYQRTERLGDLVLVAGEHIGAGKVLVFGDTTSFFNLNMPRSFELLRAVLTWFGEPTPYAWFFSRTAAALACVLAAGLLILSVLSRAVRPALRTLLLLAALSFAGHQAALLPFDQEVARDRMAVIDFSQQPFAAKHSNMPSGLFGVSASFMRHGMMPITRNDWNREYLDNAALLFLNAPRRPFTSGRRRDLMGFMDRGGTVLMACGYPHYPNARSLLDPLGIEVRDIPLGRSFDRLAFGRPIQYFSAWPVALSTPDAVVLSMYDDWPVVVEMPVGQGRLILVPDSQFFHNINLETLERHSRPNIDFLRTLLDRARGVTAP